MMRCGTERMEMDCAMGMWKWGVLKAVSQEGRKIKRLTWNNHQNHPGSHVKRIGKYIWNYLMMSAYRIKGSKSLQQILSNSLAKGEHLQGVLPPHTMLTKSIFRAGAVWICLQWKGSQVTRWNASVMDQLGETVSTEQSNKMIYGAVNIIPSAACERRWEKPRSDLPEDVDEK